MPLENRKSDESAVDSAPSDEVAFDAPNVVQLNFARSRLNRALSEPVSAGDDVSLTPAETKRLLGICIELIDLCSKVTGKIDPAVGTMVAYARDEAMVDACEVT